MLEMIRAIAIVLNAGMIAVMAYGIKSTNKTDHITGFVFVIMLSLLNIVLIWR